MDNSATTMSVSTEEIGRVAMHDDVKRRAHSVVKAKLGHLLGTGKESEVREISEDALHHVTEKLLEACRSGTTSLEVGKADEKTKIVSHPIAIYLMSGVVNYCNVRLRRWSLNNEKGEVGSRARDIVDGELADDSDYWDQHLSHNESMGSLDDERVDSLLAAKGLSGEDINLIKRNLAGWSFVDLAAELGGTADKYRRRIRRALDKAGINPDLLG